MGTLTEYYKHFKRESEKVSSWQDSGFYQLKEALSGYLSAEKRFKINIEDYRNEQYLLSIKIQIGVRDSRLEAISNIKEDAGEIRIELIPFGYIKAEVILPSFYGVKDNEKKDEWIATLKKNYDVIYDDINRLDEDAAYEFFTEIINELLKHKID